MITITLVRGLLLKYVICRQGRNRVRFYWYTKTFYTALTSASESCSFCFFSCTFILNTSSISNSIFFIFCICSLFSSSIWARGLLQKKTNRSIFKRNWCMAIDVVKSLKLSFFSVPAPSFRKWAFYPHKRNSKALSFYISLTDAHSAHILIHLLPELFSYKVLPNSSSNVIIDCNLFTSVHFLYRSEILEV